MGADDESNQALSRHVGADVLDESAATIACGEAQASRPASPHNGEQVDVDEEGVESLGRPPLTNVQQASL